MMKKIVSMMLILAMAMMLAVSAGADEFPQPEGGKKFETNWSIFGTTVEINYEEEGYRVYVKSTDPYTHSGTEWEYSCYYNEEKDALLSVSSSKNSFATDPATGEEVRGEYMYQGLDEPDQVTMFLIDGTGSLTWEDGRGQDGADLVFTDIGAFKGFWRSEDGETFADISWNDSEIGDEYGYNVFLHEGNMEHSLHGLYNPETRKLTVYGLEDNAVRVFSALDNGRILLETGGIELEFDLLGGDSQG